MMSHCGSTVKRLTRRGDLATPSKKRIPNVLRSIQCRTGEHGLAVEPSEARVPAARHTLTTFGDLSLLTHQRERNSVNPGTTRTAPSTEFAASRLNPYRSQAQVTRPLRLIFAGAHSSPKMHPPA